MTDPVRLQLSRKKGFDLHALSLATNGLPVVVVTRAAEWGNPFKVSRANLLASPHHAAKTEWWVENSTSVWRFNTKPEAIAAAVKAFRSTAAAPGNGTWRERARVALRGKNLACVCKLGDPCHADILLELANGIKALEGE